MATTAQLNGGVTFPEGTSVGAYLRSQWGIEGGPSGAPSGAAVATATVTNGVLNFTGLADGTQYYAYANVGGQHRVMAFRTSALSTEGLTLGQTRQEFWVTGQFYGPEGTLNNTSARPNGTMEAAPLWIAPGLTFDQVRSESTVVGDAGSVIRWGLYADTGAGKPGTLVADFGTVAGDSTGVKTLAVAPGVLNGGLYWVAAVTQGVTVTAPTRRVITAGKTQPMPKNGLTLWWPGWASPTATTGALPANFGTPSLTGAAPLFDVRAA